MKGVFAADPIGVAFAHGRTVVMALLVLWSGGTRAIAMPELPRAPDMRITVVSDHMVYNGVDMATYEVSSPHPMDEVLRFYREAWRGVVAESQTTMGPDSTVWTVLAHRENDFLVTLQLHPSKPNGVYGYIAISNIFSGVKHETGRGVLMPAGSTLVNDIIAEDLGRQSRTVVLQNGNSVSSNLDFYRERLKSDGWTEVTDFSGMPAQMGRPQALMMNRGGEEMNIAVTRSDGITSVVIVTVRK